MGTIKDRNANDLTEAEDTVARIHRRIYQKKKILKTRISMMVCSLT